MTSAENITDWQLVRSRLKGRLSNAFKKPTFIFSFLIFIVGIGSSGVWLPWVFDSNVTVFLRADALLTYCIAIISSMIIDFLLEGNFKVETKSLALMSVGIVIISVCLLVYYYAHREQTLCGLIGTLLTLSLWFVCNANHPKYDEVAKDASIGGEVATKGGLSDG